MRDALPNDGAMPHNTPSDILTAATVCKEFGCDRSTLSRWVKEGFITPFFQHPGERGAFLFSIEEVQRVAPLAHDRLAKKRGAA